MNAVAPGLVATGFGGWTAPQWEAMAKVTPTGKLPTAEDTAEAIVYLATTAGATGSTIIVDGGMTALGPRT